MHESFKDIRKEASKELAGTGSGLPIIDNNILAHASSPFDVVYGTDYFGSDLENNLDTHTAAEIMDICYSPRAAVIDNLLLPGTSIIAGSPKVGKSFLVLQMAYHVSRGLPLWGFSVRQGTVLYLALEDNESRLQQRMLNMFGTESTDNLHIATQAKTIGNGLEEQLRNFLRQHKDTVFVIIDVLQNVRDADNSHYSDDYTFINKIKAMSDYRDIAFLMVHHTRKMKADDPLEEVSGTNGLAGSADTTYVLRKDERFDNEATLLVVSRDMEEKKLHLEFDREKTIWQLTEFDAEPWKKDRDPLLTRVDTEVLGDKEQWTGSATEMLSLLPGIEMTPSSLSRRLNGNVNRLMREHNIHLRVSRSSLRRVIILTRVHKAEPLDDAYDDDDAIIDIEPVCEMPSLLSLPSQEITEFNEIEFPF